MAKQIVNSGISPQPFVNQIDYREINQISIIGRGAFGSVYKALWRNQLVAVKNFEEESELQTFLTEVFQLSRVQHPNIVTLYGACIQIPHVCLVMELAENGSLHNLLRSLHIKYTAGHAVSWAKQCAEGVAYLHAMKPKPMIHRDLKPLNLVLFNRGTVLKICDFGTVTDKKTEMTIKKGTVAWMAPEVFNESSYTEKCDVYSWGIILWEVTSRQLPFKEGESNYNIMRYVLDGHRPSLLADCYEPLNILMTRCWDQDPAKRPAMSDVVIKMLQICTRFRDGDIPLFERTFLPMDVDE